MKNFHSLLILLILSSSSADAASYYATSENECKTVDFRESFRLKMRNQNNVSWCFAHAASDYLQYAYQINEQVSAADVAINYSQGKASRLIHFFKSILNPKNRPLPAQTGFIKLAVNKILPEGYCPESALPSDEWSQIDSTSMVESKIEIKQSILDTFEIYKKIQNGEIATSEKLPWFFKFKNIGKEQFFEILKNSKYSQLMVNIRNTACKNERKPFANSLYPSEFAIRGKRIFKKMNASFDQGMPVTIDFFSDLFRHFDHPKNDINELHTVLVYGRKFDSSTGQCTYMIKDSYGEQCTKYDPKISCENGYVWLPENKLFHSMTSELIIHQ